MFYTEKFHNPIVLRTLLWSQKYLVNSNSNWEYISLFFCDDSFRMKARSRNFLKIKENFDISLVHQEDKASQFKLTMPTNAEKKISVFIPHFEFDYSNYFSNQKSEVEIIEFNLKVDAKRYHDETIVEVLLKKLAFIDPLFSAKLILASIDYAKRKDQYLPNDRVGVIISDIVLRHIASNPNDSINLKFKEINNLLEINSNLSIDITTEIIREQMNSNLSFS